MRIRARRYPFGSRLAVAAVTSLIGVGCHAHAEPAYVEARARPAYVHTYPRSHYEGRPVYLIDGRWHFYDRGRWVYYGTEPRQLQRERVYVERAPRAPSRRTYDRRDYDRRDYHHSPPSPRRSAPPARRVR